MMWAWTSELLFQVTWFTDRKAKRQLERIVADTQPDLIYCQLVRCAEYEGPARLPKVLDYMDVQRACTAEAIRNEALWACFGTP